MWRIEQPLWATKNLPTAWVLRCRANQASAGGPSWVRPSMANSRDLVVQGALVDSSSPPGSSLRMDRVPVGAPENDSNCFALTVLKSLLMVSRDQAAGRRW